MNEETAIRSVEHECRPLLRLRKHYCKSHDRSHFLQSSELIGKQFASTGEYEVANLTDSDFSPIASSSLFLGLLGTSEASSDERKNRLSRMAGFASICALGTMDASVLPSSFVSHSAYGTIFRLKTSAIVSKIVDHNTGLGCAKCRTSADASHISEIAEAAVSTGNHDMDYITVLE